MVNNLKMLMQIATTSITHLANLWEEISKCLCKNQGQVLCIGKFLKDKNQNGSQTSKLTLQNSKGAWILKNLWTGWIKSRGYLSTKKSKITRRWSWSLSSWERELQPGGNNSKFRELGRVKERSKNGSKWSGNCKSNFCLSTICKLSTKMILGWSSIIREMQQCVFFFFLLMRQLIHQRQPIHAKKKV